MKTLTLRYQFPIQVLIGECFCQETHTSLYSFESKIQSLTIQLQNICQRFLPQKNFSSPSKIIFFPELLSTKQSELLKRKHLSDKTINRVEFILDKFLFLTHSIENQRLGNPAP